MVKFWTKCLQEGIITPNKTKECTSLNTSRIHVVGANDNKWLYIVTSLECRVHLLSARYQNPLVDSTLERRVIYKSPLRNLRRIWAGSGRLQQQFKQNALHSKGVGWRFFSHCHAVAGLSCDHIAEVSKKLQDSVLVCYQSGQVPLML